MNSSYEILVKDLKNIGVKKGDFLVVHSSLKSMGKVEGGAECVIKALLDVIGNEGTLMLPTFTYIPSYDDLFYSNKDTPSCVGIIAETFRKQEGVVRSNHPTHSVAIKGPLTSVLLENEELGDTPMGEYSPYGKLHKYNAKILLLGCHFGRNSFMHAVEEMASAVYALRGHVEYTVINEKGETIKRRIRRHNFGRDGGIIAQRYERAIDVLDSGDYKLSLVHGATSVLMSATALREKAIKKMKEKPLYFVDDLGGFYPELK
jgi:aminoglycoside 3-N-acetyltransferase